MNEARGYLVVINIAPPGHQALLRTVDTVFPTRVAAVANAMLRLEEFDARVACINEIAVVLGPVTDTGTVHHVRTVAEVVREGDVQFRVHEHGTGLGEPSPEDSTEEARRHT